MRFPFLRRARPAPTDPALAEAVNALTRAVGGNTPPPPARRALYQYDNPYVYEAPQSPKRRPDSLVSVDDLRRLADTYDVLRSCIEHLKREVSAVPLELVAKDDKDTDAEARIKEARTLFLKDGPVGGLGTRRAHFEATVLEDLLVIGAAAIYHHPTRGGGLYECYAIDSSTIRPRVNAFGFPDDSGLVWEQWILGMVTGAYTREQLTYDGLHPVSWTPYFKSPVEWLILATTAALKADEWNRMWLTDGNTPSDMIAVPDDWKPSDIKEYSEFWDAMLAGNTRARVKTKFVPAGTSKALNPTRTEQQFQEYELWLLRRTCSIMGVQPASIGYVGEQYKSTEEGSFDQTSAFGVGALLQWRADYYDELLERCGYPDLCVQRETAASETPHERTQRLVAACGAPYMRLNEARAQDGLEAIPGGEHLYLPAGVVPMDDLVAQSDLATATAEQQLESGEMAMTPGAASMPGGDDPSGGDGPGDPFARGEYLGAEGEEIVRAVGEGGKAHEGHWVTVDGHPTLIKAGAVNPQAAHPARIKAQGAVAAKHGAVAAALKTHGADAKLSQFEQLKAKHGPKPEKLTELGEKAKKAVADGRHDPDAAKETAGHMKAAIDTLHAQAQAAHAGGNHTLAESLLKGASGLSATHHYWESASAAHAEKKGADSEAFVKDHHPNAQTLSKIEDEAKTHALASEHTPQHIEAAKSMQEHHEQEAEQHAASAKDHHEKGNKGDATDHAVAHGESVKKAHYHKHFHAALKSKAHVHDKAALTPEQHQQAAAEGQKLDADNLYSKKSHELIAQSHAKSAESYLKSGATAHVDGHHAIAEDHAQAANDSLFQMLAHTHAAQLKDAPPPPEPAGPEGTPSMSAEDAKEWAKGSALPQPFSHVTNAANTDAIHAGGFQHGKQQFGHTFGPGVYLAGDEQTAEHYTKNFTGGTPATLTAHANVKNPFTTSGNFGPNMHSEIAKQAGVWAEYHDALVAIKQQNDTHFKAGNDDQIDQRAEGTALQQALKAKGHDALYIPQDKVYADTGGHQLVVFDPKNVAAVKPEEQAAPEPAGPEWAQHLPGLDPQYHPVDGNMGPDYWMQKGANNAANEWYPHDGVQDEYNNALAQAKKHAEKHAETGDNYHKQSAKDWAENAIQYGTHLAALKQQQGQPEAPPADPDHPGKYLLKDLHPDILKVATPSADELADADEEGAAMGVDTKLNPAGFDQGQVAIALTNAKATLQSAKDHHANNSPFHTDLSMSAKKHLIDAHKYQAAANAYLASKAEPPRADDAEDEGAPTPAPAAPAAKPPQTLDFSTLTKVGQKPSGDTPGGIYQDADGKKHLVKFVKSEATAKNEVLANALYQLGGMKTPNVSLVKDGSKTYVASEWLDGARTDPAAMKSGTFPGIHDHFLLHAWLANWDAAGKYGDNIGIHDGKQTMLDAGGALEMSGIGTPKPGGLTESVTEHVGLLNPSLNPTAAAAFKGITPEQMQQQAQELGTISDEQIKAVVAANGGSPKLADTLIARKNNLIAKVTPAAAPEAPQAAQGGQGADPAAPPSQGARKPAFPGDYGVPNGLPTKHLYALKASLNSLPPDVHETAPKSFAGGGDPMGNLESALGAWKLSAADGLPHDHPTMQGHAKAVALAYHALSGAQKPAAPALKAEVHPHLADLPEAYHPDEDVMDQLVEDAQGDWKMYSPATALKKYQTALANAKKAANHHSTGGSEDWHEAAQKHAAEVAFWADVLKHNGEEPPAPTPLPEHLYTDPAPTAAPDQGARKPAFPGDYGVPNGLPTKHLYALKASLNSLPPDVHETAPKSFAGGGDPMGNLESALGAWKLSAADGLPHDHPTMQGHAKAVAMAYHALSGAQPAAPAPTPAPAPALIGGAHPHLADLPMDYHPDEDAAANNVKNATAVAAQGMNGVYALSQYHAYKQKAKDNADAHADTGHIDYKDAAQSAATSAHYYAEILKAKGQPPPLPTPHESNLAPAPTSHEGDAPDMGTLKPAAPPIDFGAIGSESASGKYSFPKEYEAHAAHDEDYVKARQALGAQHLADGTLTKVDAHTKIAEVVKQAQRAIRKCAKAHQDGDTAEAQKWAQKLKKLKHDYAYYHGAIHGSVAPKPKTAGGPATYPTLDAKGIGPYKSVERANVYNQFPEGCPQIKSHAAHNSYVVQHFQQWMDSLSSKMRSSIRTYTGGAHKTINKALRNGQMPAGYASTVQGIDAAFAKQPKLATDLVVYRGTSFSPHDFPGQPEKADPRQWLNQTFTDDGFASTTTKPTTAEGFIGGKPVRVMFKVHLKAGQAALPVHQNTSYEEEQEFMLPRGSQFVTNHLEKTIINGKETWVVHAEVV